jgi:hypothetical protein
LLTISTRLERRKKERSLLERQNKSGEGERERERETETEKAAGTGAAGCMKSKWLGRAGMSMEAWRHRDSESAN